MEPNNDIIFLYLFLVSICVIKINISTIYIPILELYANICKKLTKHTICFLRAPASILQCLTFRY